MAESRIDNVILSVVGGRWVKVAMVIAKTADAIRGDLPANDETYQNIFSRIEALVNSGTLVAQGNIEKWRFSEVRRSGDPENPN